MPPRSWRVGALAVTPVSTPRERKRSVSAFPSDEKPITR